MTVLSLDVIRATVEMEFESLGAIQNVFHLQNVSGDKSELNVIDDTVEVLEALYLLIATVIAVLQVVNGIRIINVTQLTDVGYGSFVDNTPFTGVSTAAALQSCVGLNLSTVRPVVGGRKYFGACGDGVNSGGGILNAGILTALGLAGEFMTENQVATYSTWRFGVIASLDGVFVPFVGYSMPLMMTVQRRRRTGVGI